MKNLQKHIIDEFSSDITEDRYLKAAEAGLWQSEEILIRKYFKTGSTILDIGCGTGRTTIPLHELGYKVLGVDITPKMIENAKKIADSKSLNIRYEIGDATKLKYQDSSFDNALFSNNGWSQIPGKDNRLKALKEIYRVLKPGGYYISTTHIRKLKGSYVIFWIKQWIRFFILKPLGFNIDEVDFGDRFFIRETTAGKRLKQKQYIYIPTIEELKKQIDLSGFKLIYMGSMKSLSQEDSQARRATLSSKEHCDFSPILYVCRKL